MLSYLPVKWWGLLVTLQSPLPAMLMATGLQPVSRISPHCIRPVLPRLLTGGSRADIYQSI